MPQLMQLTAQSTNLLLRPLLDPDEGAGAVYEVNLAPCSSSPNPGP